MYALLLELPLVAGLHRLITEVQAPHRHAATPMTTIVVAVVHILLQYVHPVAPVLLPASGTAAGTPCLHGSAPKPDSTGGTPQSARCGECGRNAAPNGLDSTAGHSLSSGALFVG